MDWTFGSTGTADHTGIGINAVGLAPLTADGSSGTDPYARTAANAGRSIDLIRGTHACTDIGWTSLLLDMGLLFISEIVQGAQDRVRRRASQLAEGCLSDVTAQVLQELQIAFLPSPEQIRSRISSMRMVPSLQGVHLPQDSFWVNFRKKASYIHHTGALVHDHHAA